MMPTKVCTKCGEEKDLEEEFHKDSSSKDGYRLHCKRCGNKMDALYRQNNKEKVRERHILYYQNNKEKVREYHLLYLQNNKEQRRETSARWSKNNRDKKNEINRKRRMRKEGIPGTHSTVQWEEMKKSYNYTCPMCGRSEPEITLTEDHIIPISRLDLHPTDDISNIQPLCGSCNARKGNRVENASEENIATT